MRRRQNVAMAKYFSTPSVCESVGLSEPALRHALRRPGAPRPELHPTAHVFLWTQADIDALKRFLSSEPVPHRPSERGARADQAVNDAC